MDLLDGPRSENRTSQGEARDIVFINDPLQEQWATYQIVKDGEVCESFLVPFTQQEIDLISQLLEMRNHPDILKGFANGGPEREHSLSLRIPYAHGLDDREKAIQMLRETAHKADEIVRKGEFTPGLNSREAMVAIRDALSLFIAP